MCECLPKISPRIKCRCTRDGVRETRRKPRLVPPGIRGDSGSGRLTRAHKFTGSPRRSVTQLAGPRGGTLPLPLPRSHPRSRSDSKQPHFEERVDGSEHFQRFHPSRLRPSTPARSVDPSILRFQVDPEPWWPPSSSCTSSARR